MFGTCTTWTEHVVLYAESLLYTQFFHPAGNSGGENFEGDGDEEIGVKGSYPSKTHRFRSICLLLMENFATFLYFSFLFCICLSNFSSSLNFLDVPHTSPIPPRCQWRVTKSVDWTLSNVEIRRDVTSGTFVFSQAIQNLTCFTQW